MENCILNYYRILLNYRERIQELIKQSEKLSETTIAERLRFYFQSNLKKMFQRELIELRLGQINDDIKRYEEGCSILEKWFRSNTAISKAMLIDLLTFLLSEYEHSDVLVEKRNVADNLTREEMLALIRNNTDIEKACYDYYQFYVEENGEIYQLPIMEKYTTIWYVFDLETGNISESFTMQHPQLEAGILEFLNYRIEHCEINADDILESFQEYYKKEVVEFTKVKS